ncbi:MAG TPA: hypothetical protein PLW68_13970 [Casimicrobiaceae bacterium]|nr:hypothetical protein [Casimicrobiaceae bacterium]
MVKKTVKTVHAAFKGTGIRRGASRAIAAPTVELFGHVTLVEGYALPNYHGCHALIALRDVPNQTIAVLTTQHRLQTLLETALATGNLVDCWAKRLTNPPTPRGGTWAVDVYSIDGLILYSAP